MSEAYYVQPEVQFGDRHASPVHADFGAGGEVTSTGIAFEDYSRMQTRLKKSTTGARRLAPPPYATNDADLRRVLVAYLERRAFSKNERNLLHTVQPCSEIQAINRAEQVLHSTKKQKLEATLVRLSHEYVALKKSGNADPKHLKKLEAEIQNVDTSLRVNRKAAAVVVGVLYYYYRCGMDSVGVGAEIGITPIHVRQMLKRVSDTWEEITGTKIPRVERRDAKKKA